MRVVREGERRFTVSEVTAPFGNVVVFESDRGVIAVELTAPSVEAAVRRLEARLGRAVEPELTQRSKAAKELRQYFDGRRQAFRAALDLSLATGFQREALTALRRVPFGKLVSYGELAARLGKPGAARAVGGAMAQNPVPVFIPCHRVVASDGSLGGFSGGLDVKRWLHQHEGIADLQGGWIAAACR